MPEDCFICRRVELIRRGENPTFIAELRAGYAVFGDEQFLPGYSLLLAKRHVVELHEMPGEEREQFLRDMVALGAAVARATKAAKMNYAVLGNTVPHVHAHVHARYASEPEENRRQPISSYRREVREAADQRFDRARHGALLEAIRAELARLAG